MGLFLCALLSPVVLWALPPFESFFAELKKCPFTASAGFYETGSQKVLTLPGGITVLYSPTENSLVSTLAKYNVDHLLNGGKCLSIQPPPPPNDPQPEEPPPPSPPSDPPPQGSPPLDFATSEVVPLGELDDDLYAPGYRNPYQTYGTEECFYRNICVLLTGPVGGQANGVLLVGPQSDLARRGHGDNSTTLNSDPNNTLCLRVPWKSKGKRTHYRVEVYDGAGIEKWYEWDEPAIACLAAKGFSLEAINNFE
jgi:hypothetical protein